MVVDGEVVARMTTPLEMVFDRRTMGGGPAGRLFAQMGEVLANPERHLLSDQQRQDLEQRTASVDTRASVSTSLAA